MSAPAFFYDFSSPYSYLAAARVDDVLALQPVWRPIAFGVIVRDLGKTPWSFAEDREADFAEIDRRASERGLPPVRYPDGWPRATYSLTPLRAAMLAQDGQQLRDLSRELFASAFVQGLSLEDVDAVVDAAERAGMDRAEVRRGLASEEAKDQLRVATDDALARGVSGVPTIAVGEQLFWGDDRLDEAAAAVAAAA